MAFKSLGGATGYVVVATAGTPVRLTNNNPNGTTVGSRYPCHTIFVQQVASNAGKLYILDRSTGSGATGVGVIATVPAPTLATGVAVLLPWVAITIPYAPAGFNAADYYLDADSSGDKATVSAIVA